LISKDRTFHVSIIKAVAETKNIPCLHNKSSSQNKKQGSTYIKISQDIVQMYEETMCPLCRNKNSGDKGQGNGTKPASIEHPSTSE